MLVLMTCTMAVSVPIMMVGGVLMAMREDLGLSLAARGRGAGAARSPSGFVVSPDGARASGSMQERIDEVNRVLREQITGIRVVRAFVREPLRDRALRRRPTTT